ncbi:extracellular solute-binding protein [Paenibacillus sp. IB182496]|uniref:Extracellular solute-binding protein n=1 Tax=Paenibacillus sabuli TaxID=2772509 RepID=A0A927BW52_9BACL|nr:extracellular solute-binding protein [Paenibacillus sabuli]MBD2846564.1 extracellular solute-binding protein [Paenibacillus sabuli]
MQNATKRWGKSTLLLLSAMLIAAGCSGNDNAPQTPDAPPVSDNKGNGAAASGNGQQEAPAGGGGLTLPLTDTPITYSYLIEERADAAVKNDWLSATELAKRTGVSVKFEPVPQAGFLEKKQILVATHSVPDIVSGLTAAEGRQYGTDGVFLDLRPYMEQGLMPNISRWYEEYPDMAVVSTTPDGGIYALPFLGTENWFSFALIGRQDLLDEYGLSVPTNTDELYDVMRALKEKHPEAYPFTTRTIEMDHNAGIFNIFTRAFTEVGCVIGYNPFSERYEFAAEHPEFTDMLHYLHKLYKEELLDQEFALMNSNLWEERILTNKSFFTYDAKSRYVIFMEMANNLDEATAFDMQPIPELKAPEKRAFTFASDYVQGNKNNVALSSKIKNPEVAVQYLDYLYSDEGSELLELGVEGVTYEVVDGQPVYLSSLEQPLGITLRRDYGLRYDAGFLSLSKSRQLVAEGYYEKNAAVEDMYKDIVVKPAPAVLVTEDEREIASLVAGLLLFQLLPLFPAVHVAHADMTYDSAPL